MTFPSTVPSDHEGVCPTWALVRHTSIRAQTQSGSYPEGLVLKMGPKLRWRKSMHSQAPALASVPARRCALSVGVVAVTFSVERVSSWRSIFQASCTPSLSHIGCSTAAPRLSKGQWTSSRVGSAARVYPGKMQLLRAGLPGPWISRYKHCLSAKWLQVITYGVILSVLDYCSPNSGNLSSIKYNKLDQILVPKRIVLQLVFIICHLNKRCYDWLSCTPS